MNPAHVSVAGAEVAKKSFVEALLRYGTSDHYYFLDDRPERLDDLKGRLVFYPNLKRIETVLLEEDDLSFDYLGVFDHYATTVLNRRSSVRLSDLGSSLAAGTAAFRLFEQTETGANPTSHGRQAAAFRDEQEVELAELLGKGSDEAGGTPAASSGRARS
jgi:hypothetical protein